MDLIDGDASIGSIGSDDINTYSVLPGLPGLFHAQRTASEGDREGLYYLTLLRMSLQEALVYSCT